MSLFIQWVRMRSYASVCVLCLLLQVGCSKGQAEDNEPADINSPASADSLFAFIQQIDHDALVGAYEQLAHRTYTTYVRTAQFDGEGHRLADRERILRFRAGESTVLASDSSGNFRFGYLEGFTADDIDAEDPANVAEYVVPDDPEYLSARSREVYTFAAEIANLPPYGDVRVVEIQVRPNEDASIRHATLYLEPETNRLIALRLRRSDTALWFGEVSDLFVSIRPMQSGRWVPHHARVETIVRMPLRPVQRFRKVSTFFDIDVPPESERAATDPSQSR